MNFFDRTQRFIIGGTILVCGTIAVLFYWLATNRYAIAIGDKQWIVEIAQTQAERALGLGGRAFLCQSCGMLFVFSEPDIHQFWMQGMLFPIDIVFISNNSVLSVERRIDPGDSRIFSPPAPVDAVLEVNAGQADGIVPGMVVSRFSF